jgi:uroporphyrin-III C-methyltransferase / precorrin-2 dehydrogenase / sirohydrochlorin ferrochelatase
MQFLPLFHQHTSLSALIIGGGSIAFRKAAVLSACQIDVMVICKETSQDWSELNISPIIKSFQPDDLTNNNERTLIIAATNHVELNISIADSAKQQNKFVNVVNHPDAGNVIIPAIIDRSPVMVAISSGANSPTLTRLLRGKLEGLLPHKLGSLAVFAGKWREKVKASFKHSRDRRNFWENVLEGDISESIYANQLDKADQQLDKALTSTQKTKNGEVYLVGAGPGDPELLTFKALRLMQKADVVLFDRLVSPEILDMVRRDAERINVGKARDKHLVPQDNINDLLVTLAKQGKRVLRLKGGDPFIFGRGGEEIEELVEHDIAFQVVPGITAASGCSSYAGIPLTHRDYAQSVRFITGHLKDNSTNLAWQEFVSDNQTIVFYMGLNNLSTICEQLIKHGKRPDTYAAIVQKGTRKDQKTITGTLETLPSEVLAHKISAPTLIIIGDVVKLHSKLSWFEQQTNNL